MGANCRERINGCTYIGVLSNSSSVSWVMWCYAQGLYPESHGIISNSFYDSQLKRFFYIGNPDAFDSVWWDGEPVSIHTLHTTVGTGQYILLCVCVCVCVCVCTCMCVHVHVCIHIGMGNCCQAGPGDWNLLLAWLRSRDQRCVVNVCIPVHLITSWSLSLSSFTGHRPTYYFPYNRYSCHIGSVSDTYFVI